MATLIALLNLALILLSSLLVDGSQRSFEIDKKSGKAPLTVTVSAEELYNAKLAKKFIWTFGDGQTLTTTSPSISHTFIASGNYITKLQYLKNTTDAVSKAISGGQVKIVVTNPPNNLPVVKLNCSSNISKIIDCNAIGSLDSDGTITSYLYEWGDGISSTSGNANSISHQYSVGGVKNIKLTVTDNQGGKSFINLSVNVKANSAPVASIQCSVNNLLVNCNALASYDLEGGTLRYTFTYADGFSETNTNGLSTHAYASAGLYRTTVIVSDSEGLSTTASVNVQAVLPPNILPIPQLNCNSTSPLSLVCDGLASIDQDGHIVSFKYSFDDGAIIEKGTSEVVMHGFITPGNHTVTLNVIDNDGGVNQVTKTYTVKPNVLPVVQFKCDPNYLPKRIKCSSTSYDTDNQDHIVEYSWSVGNSEAVKTIEPKFDTSVVAAGDYNIKLEVKDSFGGISTLTQKFTIVDTVAPVINFQYDTGKVFDSNLDQDFYIQVNDNEKIDFSSVSLFVNDTKVPSSKYSIDSNDNKIQVHFSLPSLMNLGPNKITINVQDSSGNTSVASVIYKLSDSIAPEISVSPVSGTHYTSQTGQIVFTLENADDADWSTFSIKLDDFDLDPTLYKIVGNKIILDISSGDLLAEDDNNFLISLADVSGNIATESAVYYLDVSSLKFDFVPSSGTKFDLTSNTVSIYPIDDSTAINWSSLKVYWNNILLDSNTYSLVEVENKILVSLDVTLKGGTLKIEGLDASQRLISSEARYYLKDTVAPIVNFSISEGSQFSNNTTPDISFDVFDQSEIDYKTLKIVLNSKELSSSKYIINSSNNRVTLKLDNNYKAQIGINNIEVNVNDTEANVGGASLNFSVIDTLPPIVSFSPVPGSSFHSNIVSLIAKVTDDSLIDWSTLELSVNNIPTPLLNYYINNNTIFVNLNEDYSFELGANAVSISVDDIWGNKLISSANYNLLEQRPIQLGFSPDRNTHFRKANPVLNTVFNFPANVQWETVAYKLNDVNLPTNVFNKINNNTISVALEGDYKLAQGLNTFTIEYKDAAGEINVESISYFLDDIYVPVIAVNPSSGTISPTQDLNFNFNVIDAGGVNTNSLVVELNGKQVANSYYAFNDSTSGSGQLKLAPGANTLKLSIKDKNGNIGASQNIYNFTYKVGPIFKFSPANWSEFQGELDQTILVDISDSVAINSLLTKAKLNGVLIPPNNLSWSSFQSRLSINLDSNTHFKAGTNSLIISATNASGKESSQSINYKFLDTIAPTISFIPNSGIEFINVNNPEINIQLSDLNGIDFDKTEILLNDTKLISSDYLIDQLSGKIKLLYSNQKLTGGENKISVKAYDKFSNVSNAVASYNLIDNLPPVTTFTPMSGTHFNNLNQSVKISFLDMSEINWGSLSLKLNNHNVPTSSFIKDEKGLTILLGKDTQLDVGLNTISVNISDKFGNNLSAKGEYFLEDIFATSFTFAPVSGSALEHVSNIINIVMSDDSDLNYSTLKLSLNGIDLPSSTISRIDNSISLDLKNNFGMRKGLNRLEISIKDSKGNLGNASASYVVNPLEIDTNGPILSITPSSAQLTSLSQIKIHASDVSGVDFSRIITKLNDQLISADHINVSPLSGDINISLDSNLKLNLGKNIFTILVVDNLGNVTGKSAYYDLALVAKNDISPPVVTFTPQGGELINSTPVVSVYFSDESGLDFSSLEVTLNNGAIDQRIMVLDELNSKLTLNFDSNYSLPDEDTSIITVRIKDKKNNIRVASVGFDKKNDSIFSVISMDRSPTTASTSCAILELGKVKCWGANFGGQAGYDNSNILIGDNEVPSSLPFLDIPEAVKQVSAGDSTSCAVTVTGKLYCWGADIGNRNIFNLGATLVNVGGAVTQVTAGISHTCVLMESGGVRCFGFGYGGALGNGTDEDVGDDEQLADVPEIMFEARVARISAGSSFTCALLVDGRMKCWGINGRGQLGQGDNLHERKEPKDVPFIAFPSRVIQMSTNANNVCALLETGKLFCWGANDGGQVGFLSPPVPFGQRKSVGLKEAPSSTPGVNLPLPAIKVSVGNGHACAILNNFTLRCWGTNGAGETGDGTAYGSFTNGSNVINLGGKVLDVSTGTNVTFATMEDGTLKGFGRSDLGQLGLGTTIFYGNTEPVNIPAVALGSQVQIDSPTTPGQAAYFDANIYYGPSALYVSFDASKSSMSGEITYHWNFGDGFEVDSMSDHVHHIYNTDGVYKAKLTISNADNEEASYQRTITVGANNNPPFAFFNIVKDYGIAPFNASFDASASFDVNGSITSYVWNFGDESTQTSTSAITNHTYTDSGSYLVTMKAVDNAGASVDAFPQVVTVKEFNMSPFASFNCIKLGKKIDCSAFSSSDLDGNIVNYKWNFGDEANTEGFDKYETNHLYSEDGTYNVHLIITDNNGAETSHQIPVLIDTIAPNILAYNTDNILTDDSNYSLSVLVDDVSDVQTTISLNNQVAFVSNDHVVEGILTLAEGLNTVNVTSIDSSGNKTLKTILYNVVLDTIAPSLAYINPTDGAVVSKQTVTISGRFSEKLSALTLNDQPVNLNEDGKSFSYNFTAYKEGAQELVFVASDIVGNTNSFVSHIDVQLKILYPELISIQYLSSTQLKVIGAPGAVKSSADITLSSGFFNSIALNAGVDGSFETTLKYFTSAKITVTDSLSGRSESSQLDYNVDTTLAGTIKDTDGNPLPGVKITMKDTDIESVVTNASGIFSFSNPPTGDRQLIIDAQSVPVEAVGPNKKFSVQEIPVSIGIRQANVLTSPIYLAPLMYDGSETIIEAGVSTTVESPLIENVAIEIPSNVDVIFPEGNTLNAINLAEISKNKTTVPVLAQVEPDTVIALEPSGLTFSEPVQLTLPNPNDFPAGMQVMIYSKNSKTGTWEIDGIAKVDESGDKIITQDGMGITHFSEVYAAPMGLKYSQINSQDKIGVDTFNGAVSTSIKFPGYKALATELSPKLIYKSNWAYPTATITNIFQIPDEVVMISYEGKRIIKPAPGDVGYIKTWVVPESVDLDFIAGDYHSPKMTLTGLPSKAVVSLGMDFKNQSTGIIPFAANYEIHLKRMIIKTELETYGNAFNIKTKINETPAETLPSEILPSELRGQLYIQNKSQSSAGKGWMIGGVQKIINPGSAKLMIEEEDGSVSTYVSNNKLNTVAKIVEGFSGMFASSSNNIIVSGNNNDVYEIDLDQGTKSTVKTAPTYTGLYRSNRTYNQRECSAWTKVFGKKICAAYAARYYCEEKQSSFTLLPTKKYTIPSPDGNGYIMASEKGVITFNSTTIGKFKTPPNSDSDLTFCSSTATCSGSAVTRVYPAPGCYGAPASSGVVYDQGFEEGSFSNARFNTIKSLSSSVTQNGFAVADYGNHRIRFVNLDTQKVSTLAGNGKIEDSGDGGQASDAGIFHPLGTVYDSNGNLYVSTENGYIRKIDSSGKITKIAGNPKGVFNDKASALDMYLSRPYGLALDEDTSSLFVADSGNHRILKINLISGIAQTVAGNGYCQVESSTNTTHALNSSLCNPEFVLLDNNKNLIIADTGHKSIKRVIFSDSVNGSLQFDSIAKDGSSITRNTDGTYLRVFRSGMKSNFDKFGKHISSLDRLGKITINNYNSAGALIEQIDPVGNKIFYDYGSFSGTLNKIRYSVDNREFSFSYDLNKNLNKVFFPDGTIKEFVYDENGLLLKEIDQMNIPTTYVYNNWKRLAEVVRADGKKITINDSQSANMANNFTGGVKGRFKTQGSDEDQLVDGIKDAKGITTSYIHDETGYVSAIVASPDNTTKVHRDLDGKPIQIIRPDESVVDFVYDNLTGDLIEKRDSSTNTTINFEYDSFGNLLSKIDGSGRKIVNTYNSQGLLVKTTHETLGTSVNYSYNALGLLVTQTNSLGEASSIDYDSKGNIVHTKNSDGKMTSYYHNNSGFLREIVDPESNKTIYEYDEMNRIISVSTGDNQKTQYSYQETGELIQILDPNEKITNFYYDDFGQLVKKVGNRNEISEYSYDENGNLKEEITPAGMIKKYYYDDLNQLIKKSLPDDEYNFAYDLRGNVVSIKNSTSIIDMSYKHYDDGDVITRVHTYGQGDRADLPNTVLNYNYNDLGEKIGMETSKGSFQYGRDAAGRLRSIINHKGEVFTMKYDLNQRIKEITTPATVSAYSYDHTGFGTQIHYQRKSGATIEKFIYGKDNTGNRISKTTSDGTTNYEYDKNYQLVKAISPVLPVENFTYDSTGNRLSDIRSIYKYDESKQLIQEDSLYLYVFDSNGNLITKQEKGLTGDVENFDYNSENQLEGYKKFKNNSLVREAHYTYDALGRRVEKSVVDHLNSSKSFVNRYSYDGESILFELDENNYIKQVYTHSTLKVDDPLAVANSQGTFFFVKDGLGTITDITDDQGYKIQHLVYTSFGVLKNITDGNGQDITQNPVVDPYYTFSGREFDKETGLYYYRARYYDPNIGRFLSIDPDAGKLLKPITHINKYIYAGNNPINLVDPTGRSFMSEVGGFFGGKGGWGVDVITAVAVVGVLYMAGATFTGAVIAVATTALGAAAAASAMAAFQKGKFFENFSTNFHTIFRTSAAFLAGSAIFAKGGVMSAGGTNGLQGYVESRGTFGNTYSSGLTIGSSSTFSGDVAFHEFVHTLEFIGMAGFAGYQQRQGATSNPLSYLYLTYGGAGVLGGIGQAVGFPNHYNPFELFGAGL